jgi:hypothetical protein
VLTSIPSYPRPVIERLVAKLIEHLDAQDGDPELEGDPLNEGEPAFDAQSRAMANEHPGTDPNCDAEEDDPGEDGNDAEPETWSHPDDHPAELFVGRRSHEG